MYEIIVIAFLVNNQAYKIKFLEKTFQIANVSPEMVFKKFFLTLSGVNVNFLE